MPLAKEKLFCLKSFVPVTRTGVFIWENCHPDYRDLGSRTRPASHINTRKFLLVAWRDIKNRASLVDQAHMKRPEVRIISYLAMSGAFNKDPFRIVSGHNHKGKKHIIHKQLK